MMNDVKIRVAVLGPLGTYTHEAAFKAFGSQATYDERTSVADVLAALSPEIPFGVIPQENTIFGPVVETYDCLRSEDGRFIRGEITLKVEHCLLVKKGVQLCQIKRIMSHEQALGQCRDFIGQRLPGVENIKTSSTAAAAKAVSENGEDCAAICSSICESLFEGLEVLFTGIQNERSNFTRFFIVSHSREANVPDVISAENQTKALIRLSMPPPTTDNPHGISGYLGILNLFATRIDRRPSLGAIPFQNTYFVEVEASGIGANAITKWAPDSWIKEVEESVAKVNGSGGHAVVAGIW